MADKKKKLVRDVQNRTGWKYSFCLFLVDNLGYEEVSRCIDDNVSSMESLGDGLNERAKEAQKATKF